ncbi:hypothetical protein BH23THE1_BH23THE1_03000 [soil metagenome]
MAPSVAPAAPDEATKKNLNIGKIRFEPNESCKRKYQFTWYRWKYSFGRCSYEYSEISVRGNKRCYNINDIYLDS